jgi:DNA-binding YbaB/EbfC family protein
MEDFTKIMSQMKEAQAKVQEIQQKLVHIQATGEAGAGAVKATVDGHKKILKLDIDTEFIRPEEKEVLQDLIIAAITLATQAVDEKVQGEVKQNASGILGGLPIDLML